MNQTTSNIKIGRTILGVIVGYLTNAAMVGMTEAIYVKVFDRRTYLEVDLLTQVVATIVGGYLCCSIARRGKGAAAAGLTVLGLLIGLTSLLTAWNAEPHWYGIALLFVYAPCVWTGYAITNRKKE